MQDEAAFPTSNKDSRIARKLGPVNPAKSHHVSNFPEIKRLDPSRAFEIGELKRERPLGTVSRRKAIGIETTLDATLVFALSEPRENRPLSSLHPGLRIQ
ncbi:hypothetical protein K0M31_002699 [Melipona bicolor]|uniref:Uncharacterized protein n=1 Tax=Melipona bicolor TaxID=60889 RepID=A0AA40FZC4_9HYME|nr:hypothetical protein K0M31_002699 [Melipona bicolor]